ncbi:hypothetical protein V8C26DRAFT_383621 [Trichoderma gracile]
MKGLCAFLGFNVYFWSEYFTRHGNADVITQAARLLHNYAARRAKVIPTDGSISFVEKGADRLLEVAGKFHHNCS